MEGQQAMWNFVPVLRPRQRKEIAAGGEVGVV
jgi:hypothetical protein